MMKAPYTGTDLLNIAEAVHEVMNQAAEAVHNSEDESFLDIDKHYNKAIAIMRNVAEGRDWTDGVEGYTDLRTPEEL